MSSPSTRIGRAPRSLEQDKVLAHYDALLPVQQAVHMTTQFGDFMFVLGQDRVDALQGISRLSAVSRAPHLLQPQNALEVLLMGFRKPWRLIEELKPYAPELVEEDWTRIAKTDWMIPNEPKLAVLSPPAQLLLYRVGAWRNSYVFVGRPVEEKLAVWDTIPEAVRRDPLMQQIVAIKSPDLFEALIDRDPAWSWDVTAQALFLQNSAIPSARWIQRVPDDVVRMVFAYNKHNTKINALDMDLLHFSDAQLPLLEELNPALFIQGLIMDRDRREEPQASLWFDRMWNSVLKKTAQDPGYANLLINQRTMVHDGVHVERVFKLFNPEAIETIGVSLALEDDTMLAWRNWLLARANASVADHSITLPDLDTPAMP